MPEKDFWDEVWRPVNFKGLNEKEKYEISNYGRIRLFKDETNGWRLMKTANVNGYQYYSFKSDINWKVRRTKCVHVLVAELFCNKPSDKHSSVIHLDFNKSNNYFRNLKWATTQEVNEHSRKSPMYKQALIRRKGKATNAKLTETEVIRLKKKLKRGKNPLYKIAKEFGITHTQLNRIRRGENWGHVKVD
ncbi:MAG: hypothetical protein JXB00_19830 [Bacteroidales bacterium]|nr:hypothetical protein [Bacteroidales bacterium]